MKLVLRRLNRNAEPQASIESGQYTYQLVKAPRCFSLQVILPIITYTYPSISKVPLKSHTRILTVISSKNHLYSSAFVTSLTHASLPLRTFPTCTLSSPPPIHRRSISPQGVDRTRSSNSTPSSNARRRHTKIVARPRTWINSMTS